MLSLSTAHSFQTLKEKIIGDGLGAVLARGAGGAILVRVAGAVVALGTQVLLARVLGADQYGIYAYVLSWLIILVLPAKLGLDTMLLRFASAYRARKEWGLLQAVIRSSTRLVLLSSLLVGTLLFLAVSLLGDRISSDLRLTFWIACAVLPILALLQLWGAVLRSLQWVVRALLPMFLLQPLILVSAVSILAFVIDVKVYAPITMVLHLVGCGVALLLIFYWAKRGIEIKTRPAYENARLREWISVALPMVLVAGFAEINQRADVIMAGAILGTTPAGIYAVAVRLAIFVNWGLWAVDMIAAPLISQLYAEGTREDLQRLVSQAAVGLAIFTLPVAFAILIFGKQLLWLFGESFIVGYTPLLVIVLGQCVNALTGPVGYLLIMTGHQRDAAWTMGTVAGANILLNALLIPRWELVGAALATAISAVLLNAIMYLLVMKHLKVDPTILGLFRARE